MDQKISDKVADLRRAYQKEWRAKNKARVREYNRRFWEKRAEKEIGSTEKTTPEN